MNLLQAHHPSRHLQHQTTRRQRKKRKRRRRKRRTRSAKKRKKTRNPKKRKARYAKEIRINHRKMVIMPFNGVIQKIHILFRRNFL